MKLNMISSNSLLIFLGSLHPDDKYLIFRGSKGSRILCRLILMKPHKNTLYWKYMKRRWCSQSIYFRLRSYKLTQHRKNRLALFIIHSLRKMSWISFILCLILWMKNKKENLSSKGSNMNEKPQCIKF